MTIRTPTSDITVSLTVGLPFQLFENHLLQEISSSGYQNWSLSNFAAGPSTINPKLTLYEGADDGYLRNDCNLGPIEVLETMELQSSLQISGTSYTLCDTWTPDSSIRTALKSVVPKLFTEGNMPGSFAVSPNTQLFKSSLHRQILFSMANNFAGLGAFPIMDLVQFLQRETNQSLYQLARSARSHSSRAIVQKLFKAAIEVGDGRIVHVLLDDNPRDLDVNEQFCSVDGGKYTPIERASMLRHESLVKCLLDYRADVNKTYSFGGNGGALDYATVRTHNGMEKLDLHPRIFRILLEAGGNLSSNAMTHLFRHGEEELRVLFLSINASNNAARWSELGVFHNAMLFQDDHTSLQMVGIMLKYGVDINQNNPLVHHYEPSNNPFKQRLIDEAAQRGNLKTVKLLLESGALLTGDTLSCAIASANQDLILWLLTLGADINGIGFLQVTPLAAAIRLRDPEILKIVTERGASVTNQAEEHFSAALKAASEVGDIQLIERLIQAGGKVGPDDLGHAFMAAIESGGDDFAQFLINAGADNISPATLGAALSVAIMNGRDVLAEILIDAGANVNLSQDQQPPLLQALKRRKEALVLSLLDADANPNYSVTQGNYGQAPSIVLAAEWGSRSMIETLKFAGADIDGRKTGQGSETALTIAVKRQDYDLIYCLLALGADINNRDCQEDQITVFGNTALESAAENGDIKMTRFLLDQGADPNDSGALRKAMLKDENLFDLLLGEYRARYPMSKGNYGASVLAGAIREGNGRMIRLMLERGVNANLLVRSDDQIATPFGHAIARQQENLTEFLELFLLNGCNPNDVVAEASGQDFGLSVPDKVFDPWMYGLNPAPRITALLAAIGTRNISTVELFIKNGADVNFPARWRIKRTPLQRAAEVGSLDIVELLINHGANIHAPAAERRGGTALQFAAIGGYIAIACKLLSLRADPNAPASKVYGRTALEGAAEHGRLDMLQVLLNGGAASRPGDEQQVANAIAFARDNGHITICDLLESHLSSRQGSGLELLADNSDGNISNFSLDDDPFSSYVDFGGAE